MAELNYWSGALCQKRWDWQVGNEQQIKIREDRWLKKSILGGPGNQDEPRLVVKLMNAEEAQWNEQKLHTPYDEQTVILSQQHQQQ